MAARYRALGPIRTHDDALGQLGTRSNVTADFIMGEKPRIVLCGVSKARKARNALRRCFKIICLLKWWTKATYSPPSSGGAGYRRLQQEAMASGMHR